VLKKISSFAEFHSFQRGERIFSEDSSGECLYVLVNGRVKIYATAGPRTKTFALLDPGDFFGEMALLGQPLRSANARAILDSKLLVLERKDFNKFIRDDSALALTLLRTVCDRLRRADKEIEMLSFQNVVGRTAITLIELDGKYGKPDPRGSLIETVITHQELSDLIGTVREMVTRVLSKFRAMNAIAFDKSSGKIILLNREKLKNCIYQ
jgi:CRP/FNR family transcriptional regulator